MNSCLILYGDGEHDDSDAFEHYISEGQIFKPNGQLWEDGICGAIVKITREINFPSLVIEYYKTPALNLNECTLAFDSPKLLESFKKDYEEFCSRFYMPKLEDLLKNVAQVHKYKMGQNFTVTGIPNAVNYEPKRNTMTDYLNPNPKPLKNNPKENTIIILYGDGKHDDSDALEHYLQGKDVFKPNGDNYGNYICNLDIRISRKIKVLIMPCNLYDAPIKNLVGCTFVFDFIELADHFGKYYHHLLLDRDKKLVNFVKLYSPQGLAESNEAGIPGSKQGCTVGPEYQTGQEKSQIIKDYSKVNPAPLMPSSNHEKSARLAVSFLQELCHNAAYMAGWWPDATTDNPFCFSNKLMLCVSELAEAMEGDRKNLPDDKLPHRPMREVELADALIRIFDLAGAYDMDLAGALVEKMAYNSIRLDHKPQNRAADGGKTY